MLLYKFSKLHSLNLEHYVFVRYEAFLTIDTPSPPVIGYLGEENNSVALFKAELPLRASHEVKLRGGFQALRFCNIIPIIYLFIYSIILYYCIKYYYVVTKHTTWQIKRKYSNACFLCFVDCASLYNLLNKANLVHNLFLVYLSISTCFRRLCAHHQEKQLCLCDTWYLLFCMDDCLVCRVEWNSSSIPPCIPDIHPYRITSTKCRINTVVSPDDGRIVAWNMWRLINILRKNCAPSRLYKTVMLGFHFLPLHITTQFHVCSNFRDTSQIIYLHLYSPLPYT